MFCLVISATYYLFDCLTADELADAKRHLDDCYQIQNQKPKAVPDVNQRDMEDQANLQANQVCFIIGKLALNYRPVLVFIGKQHLNFVQ